MSVLLLLLSTTANAWGPVGHRAVAEIAQRHLDMRSKRQIDDLLGGRALADVANWPDWIRSDPAARANGTIHPEWHYTSVPDGSPTIPTDGGVLWAIAHNRDVLGSKDVSTAERRTALAWLVHLVGDIHQPLHVGRSEDRGGNTQIVTYQGDLTNLHKVWDEDLIDHERWSYTELATYLDHASDTQLEQWSADAPMVWAQESLALRGLVYDMRDGRRFPEGQTNCVQDRPCALAWDYRFRAWPVVEQRLLQAGIRLAAILDQVL